MKQILKALKKSLNFPYYFFKRFTKINSSVKDIPSKQGKVIEMNGKKLAVYKNKNGKLIKLNPKCTHLGCLVNWDKKNNRWECKCHGSTFSKEGKVLSGPAKKNLELKESKKPEYQTKILMTEFITHDVKRFILEKPSNYSYSAGEATKIAINRKEWKDKKRPFTFTSLNEDKVLEFTIKKYPKHNGVTAELHKLKPGAELIIEKPFNTFEYKGKGVFIAGGTGITPFIAIFRDLYKKGKLDGNRLFFSNKEVKDIILEKELKESFQDENLNLVLTREKSPLHEYSRINYNYLKEHVNDFSQPFYICGPPSFVKDISENIKRLDGDSDTMIFY